MSIYTLRNTFLPGQSVAIKNVDDQDGNKLIKWIDAIVDAVDKKCIEDSQRHYSEGLSIGSRVQSSNDYLMLYLFIFIIFIGFVMRYAYIGYMKNAYTTLPTT